MMNLKYYLRGLGVGVVVTALIMGIAAGGKKERLSNEEIKERARALGMVEESTVLANALGEQEEDSEKSKETEEPLAQLTPTPAATEEPAPVVPEQEEPSAAPSPDAESELEPVKTPEPAKEEVAEAPEPAAAEVQEPVSEAETEEEKVLQDGSLVTIQVNKGDGSLTVSRKLEEAGLIASAYEFDRYLCQNGYDKRLNVGTFEIPAGTQPEQMAKILAKTLAKTE